PCPAPPPTPHPFPTRRSSDLDGKAQLCHPRDEAAPPPQVVGVEYPADPDTYFGLTDGTGVQAFVLVAAREPLPSYAAWKAAAGIDRKSTRLNSSHRTISYAVF